MSEAPSTDPQNCGGMLPMRTPCPFCGGVEFRIEAGGQTWRGVKGYSDPQYWHLYHNGTIPEGDGFQMCSVQIRARTEAELYSIWDWRADTVSAQLKAAAVFRTEVNRAYIHIREARPKHYEAAIIKGEEILLAALTAYSKAKEDAQ